MSSYTARSEQIIASACKDAGKKLLAKHDRVRQLWGEAHSIPSGCGCTPFYAAARDAEEQLRKEVLKFKDRYGAKEFEKLHLFYGSKR